MFSSGLICTRYIQLAGHFHLDGENLQMQTYFVPQIKHKDLK